MVGYVESLTDPSYCRQILVLTYPLIGNYGVPPSTTDELGVEKYFESHRIWAAGLIVDQVSESSQYSHWNAVQSLQDWMVAEKIPGISGIDTRALTMKIREKGTMMGKVIN